VDNPEVTPAERWAVYSLYPTYHKITGNLTTAIYYSLGYDDLCNYVYTKHNIPKGALELCNFVSLKLGIALGMDFGPVLVSGLNKTFGAGPGSETGISTYVCRTPLRRA
jgi:hypothetical protein